MATYYALTTLNAQTNGWSIVAIGGDKATVEDEARAAIHAANGTRPNTAWDIYTDTEMKNLVVVSKTVARRGYGIDEYALDAFYSDTDGGES